MFGVDRGDDAGGRTQACHPSKYREFGKLSGVFGRIRLKGTAK